MKKAVFILPLIVAVVLVVSRCGMRIDAGRTPISTPTSNSKIPMETKAFTYGGLEFEVTGAVSDRTEVYKDDGGADVDLLIITYKPNAELRIIQPDMNSGEFTELGQPYPQWGLDYKSKQSSGEKVRIDDKTGIIKITDDLIAIYDLEASLYVVKFEKSE